MLDNKSLKLLKRIRKSYTLTAEEIFELTGTESNKQYNKYICKLCQLMLIEPNHLNDKNFNITLDGHAYLEERKRRFLAFVIPYAITTLTAVLGFFISIFN